MKLEKLNIQWKWFEFARDWSCDRIRVDQMRMPARPPPGQNQGECLAASIDFGGLTRLTFKYIVKTSPPSTLQPRSAYLLTTYCILILAICHGQEFSCSFISLAVSVTQYTSLKVEKLIRMSYTVEIPIYTYLDDLVEALSISASFSATA